MKNLFLFLILSVLTGGKNYTQAASSRDAIVYQEKDVRFTMLAEGVVRMEWSPSGQFVDAPSFVVVERNLPVPEYKVCHKGEWVLIETAKMEVKYKKHSGKFTSDNLMIKAVNGLKPFCWKPGMQQKDNLKGTFRTLDGYDGNYSTYKNQEMPLEDGLLARDGWTLIDDSADFLFDDSDWPWVKKRGAGEGQDWYFMAYGNDYKGALKDFTLFAGKVPLPPRYAFGYWWSRYWSYSDKEIRQLIDNFRHYQLPLDVLVVDMDWHYTEKGKGGWTGWTWNRRLFPDPVKFLRHLKDRGLKVTLNLHPAGGVAAYEEQYPAMAEWMGIDSASGATLPWTVSDKKYMQGIFDIVLRPMEKAGVDFWWLDWQQWLTDKKVEGLSNTWWINYAFFSDMERMRDTRPLLYHRWGGLGNHRYQIGFSGDAIISWKSLAFQPYFTNCASNVLYGYWSHDIGGHMFKKGDKQELDPELFTRWMQYGVFTPVFRTHSTKNAVLNKEIWNFKGEYFEALRNAVLLRYQLVPYLYTMARETYENGLSVCRPLYYDYPESEEAYRFEKEYMFGENLLIAPIVEPMQKGYAKLEVWLPGGSDWYEWSTGTLLKGGQIVERSFGLAEYPVYIKAGSILPLYDRVENLSRNDEEIVLTVFPGQKGSFRMYEDNGNDKHYAREYAYTPLSVEQSGPDLTVTIGAREGHYRDMPAERSFKIKILGSVVPEQLTVNGQTVAYEYLGEELALVIPLPEKSCAKEKVVQIRYPVSRTEVNDGLIGQFRRLSKAISALKFRDAGIVLNEALGTLESTSVALEYFPERFPTLIEQFRQNYRQLPRILTEQQLTEADRRWFLETVGWDEKE